MHEFLQPSLKIQYFQKIKILQTKIEIYDVCLFVALEEEKPAGRPAGWKKDSKEFLGDPRNS